MPLSALWRVSGLELCTVGFPDSWQVFSGPREDGWGLPAPTHAYQVLPSWQREVDRNQELLTRIRQLQEREAEAEAKMQEQIERSRQCRQSLDAAHQQLRDKEDGLAEASEVRGHQTTGLSWFSFCTFLSFHCLHSEDPNFPFCGSR